MAAEIRQLTSRDWIALQDLLDRDPIANCFVATRVRGRMPTAELGGPILGCFAKGALVAALAMGTNVVPIATTPTSRAAFAGVAARGPRRASSIVGPADEVLDLWRRLAPAWGPAREIRPNQLLMATDAEPNRPPHPDLRPLRPDELELLVPAAVAMFTEEVGVSPLSHGGGPAYRARLAEILAMGHALGIVEDGRLRFKAEIGSAARTVCQIQGVWVDPVDRGLGLGTAGMAGVVQFARRHVAPTVSLYVNDFNARAVAAYRAVGFEHVGTFATVLF